MTRILILLLTIALTGCATFPLPSGSEEGRLVISSELIRHYPNGPWWNYQIWAKNDATGKKSLININVSGSKKIHLSQPLPAGEYTIYEWNSVSKSSGRVLDHDIQGGFEIKASTLTIYDHKLSVTMTDSSQQFKFKQMGDEWIKEFAEIVKNSHENAANWGIFWAWTKKVKFEK